MLLELARTLDVSSLKNEVWLAFFDAEDDGDLGGCVVAKANGCDNTSWPWSVGATYVAEHLTSTPGRSHRLRYDWRRRPEHLLRKKLGCAAPTTDRGIAATLGYSAQFIPQFNWSMEDDHTPFLQRKIRAVDMIDFDYPYWHTTQDTADKVSAASLERVGCVMKTWLEQARIAPACCY